jgi:hypothetical protein
MMFLQRSVSMAVASVFTALMVWMFAAAPVLSAAVG